MAKSKEQNLILCVCERACYKNIGKQFRQFSPGDEWSWPEVPVDWKAKDQGSTSDESEGQKDRVYDFANATQDDLYRDDKEWTKKMLNEHCKEAYGIEVNMTMSKPVLIDWFISFKASR